MTGSVAIDGYRLFRSDREGKRGEDVDLYFKKSIQCEELSLKNSHKQVKSLWVRTCNRTCGPMEKGAHAGANFLAGLVTPWGTHTGAACSWRSSPMEGTHAGAVREELQPVGRISTHGGAGYGRPCPVGGTSRWSSGRV